ncbi:putative pectinesterase inhibitor domain-containing protein [Helianthus debilis subsp. tardiflorus]
MFSPSWCLPFFLFAPLFLSIHAQTLIHSTCKVCSQQDPTVNYQFCTTSLEAASGSRHADVRGLGKISLQLTHTNVSDTRSHIKNLLKKKASSSQKMRLDDCFELYSDAVTDIKHAMKSYKSKHYDEANVLISSVMDAATTCENGFKEKRNVVSPLTKRNNETFELCGIGLSIIHILRVGAK